MKKSLVVASLTLSLSVASPTFALATEQPINVQLQVPSISQIANETLAIEKQSQSFNETVKTYEDYKKAMIKLYNELPRTMRIKSTLGKNKMDEFSKKFEKEIVAGDLPNYKLLAHYKVRKVGNIYIYTDNSHKKFSAKQIESYIDTFASRFAESIKHLSPSERFNTIYNYVYSNFEYNASGYQYMMVGNAYNYEMACNGISRLMYEMLNAAGIESRIIEGEDHYYNLVSSQTVFGNGEIKDNSQIDDWFIVDVTTDILLEQPHGATGKEMSDYLAYVLNTKIYTAKPIAKEKNKIIKLNDSLISMLKNNLAKK